MSLSRSCRPLDKQVLRALTSNLDKRVDQQKIERWSATFWEQPREKKSVSHAARPYVIMFPPPNVTGNLHLGHALTGAIQDALVRQKRMQGYNCIFIPGFDHAGLATQNIVEKLLWNQKNITRQQLGREKFVELADEWKEQKRVEMRGQLNRLGLDLDHDREYFTMDENSSQAVHEAFKRLFKLGIIYRSERPVFWSNQLHTTLSDIEVERVDGVNKYVRTGEVVEKRPLSQWFIDAGKLAKRSVDVVERGDIKMIPSNYKRSWSSWLLENGIQDWCISRQSWWGHRIPAYKVDSSPDVRESWVVADSRDSARSLLNNEKEVVQDPDVLDTWFSSSLLPLTVSGWPNAEIFSHSCETSQFPLNIMETGFDILTYWVSKMVMMSLALTDQVPFNLILLHGMICDSDGKKMSKSRGNVIDPLDVIDGATLDELQERTLESFAQGILESTRLKSVLNNQRRIFPDGIPPCGADGLRAYLLSHDFQEEVVRVRIEQIEKVRRLSNKIWNIFRFYLMIMNQVKEKPTVEDLNVRQIDIYKLDSYDKTILSRLYNCVQISHNSFELTYLLHHSFKAQELFWNIDLSQNYIDKVKDILLRKSGSKEEQRHKVQLLGTCLLDSTKLLHPFMPHLTEFLYQKLMYTLKEKDIDSNLIERTKLLSYEQFPRREDWKIFDENHRRPIETSCQQHLIMSELEEKKGIAKGVCKSSENVVTAGDNNSASENSGADNPDDSDVDEVIPSGPLATTRSRRANAGNRMGQFMQDDEDELYTSIYGGFEEEEDDEDFQAEEADNENLDKDVEDQSNSDSTSSSGSSSDSSDSESSNDEENDVLSDNQEVDGDVKPSIVNVTSDRSRVKSRLSPKADSKSSKKNMAERSTRDSSKAKSVDMPSNIKFRPGSPSKLAYEACARICSVCLGDQSGDDDEVIECDSCGVTVHESCYGISAVAETNDQDTSSVHSNISSESTEPWFCEPCKRSVKKPYCELCPNTGGVFKETDTGRWVHMVCALYIRGVTFENTDNLTGVSLFELSYALYGSKACTICEDRRLARSGICIGCDAGLCKTFFHPTCAQKEGYLFESHSDEVDPYFAQCKQHADKSVIKRKKKTCTALFARLNRVQLNQEPSDRIKRKLSEITKQLDSHLTKWTPDNPPPIPARASKMLMTCPSLIIQLTKKSELIGLDPNSAFMTVQDEMETARQKWHIPPAFNLEFVAYCRDRTLRMIAMKKNNSELMNQNLKLKNEEVNLRERYNSIEETVLKVKAENEALIEEARALQRAVSLCTDKQFNLPIQIEQLITRCTSSKAKSPAKSNSKAASKANATHECIKCGTVKDQHLLALCDTCKFHIHIYCLDPPLSRVPKKTKFGGWQCSDCSEKDEEEQEDAMDEQNLIAIQEVDGPRRLRERIKYPDKYCHESMLMSDFWSTSKKKSKKSKKSSKAKQIKLEV